MSEATTGGLTGEEEDRLLGLLGVGPEPSPPTLPVLWRQSHDTDALLAFCVGRGWHASVGCDSRSCVALIYRQGDCLAEEEGHPDHPRIVLARAILAATEGARP